jgi:hypothetical protein
LQCFGRSIEHLESVFDPAPKTLNAVRIDSNGAFFGFNVAGKNSLVTDRKMIEIVFLQTRIRSPFIREDRTT